MDESNTPGGLLNRKRSTETVTLGYIEQARKAAMQAARFDCILRSLRAGKTQDPLTADARELIRLGYARDCGETLQLTPLGVGKLGID